MPGTKLPTLIRALLRPSAYPHPSGRVRLIQTHISYVLLAGEHVYKIKKPVSFGFLDFSTLGKRRYYCRQEVVLNSRLCADTYLGVVPIRDEGGRFSVGGRSGRIVEYAVHMRRLPQEGMMDRLLRRNAVSAEMVQQVADRVAAFHAEAETSARIARFGDWAIRYDWKENIEQWQPYIGRVITAEQDRILRAYGEAFFARKAAVLQRRVEKRRIKHVHADLRADSVCFTDTSTTLSAGGSETRPYASDGSEIGPYESICIFDCVEFSRRISLLDVARDVGFLAMDLEYRGRGDLGRAFIDRYVEVSGDRELYEIVEFYAAYSACVRGKVKAFLLDEKEVPDAEKRRARKAARDFFALACRYAEALPPAMLVITCGLSGTGKSTVARGLAERAGFKVMSSDVVRKERAGIAPGERRIEAFGQGIYAAEAIDRIYADLLRQAGPLLLEGRSVILDATFIRRKHRQQAAALAKEAGAQFACLEIEASSEAVCARLGRRLREGRDPSDARWEIYVAQKRRFQRPTEVPAERRIVVDGARPVGSQVARALAGLRAVSPLSVFNQMSLSQRMGQRRSSPR